MTTRASQIGQPQQRFLDLICKYTLLIEINEKWDYKLYFSLLFLIAYIN
jgi:hypothetical protein